MGQKNILACGTHFNEGEHCMFYCQKCLDDGTSLFQIHRIVKKCKPTSTKRSEIELNLTTIARKDIPSTL